MKRTVVVCAITAVLVASSTYAVQKKAPPAGSQSAAPAATSPSFAEQPPAAPSFFLADGPTTPSSTSINLSWKDNAADETGFVLVRSEQSQQHGSALLIKIGPNVTHYTDTGLQPEKQYFYRLARSGGAPPRPPLKPAQRRTPSPPKR